MNSKCRSDAQLRKMIIACQTFAELRWFTPERTRVAHSEDIYRGFLICQGGIKLLLT